MHDPLVDGTSGGKKSKGLGELLYQHVNPFFLPAACLFLLFPVLMSLFTVIFGPLLSGDPKAKGLPGFIATLTLLSAILLNTAIRGLLRYYFYKIDLHENGVRERRGRSEVIRYYDEFRTVLYRKIGHPPEPFGQVPQVTEHLLLKPTQGIGKSIKLSRRWKSEIGRNTVLREVTPMETAASNASLAIASRLAEELALGETVPWTPRMRLNHAFLEYSWPGSATLVLNGTHIAQAAARLRSWLVRFRRPWIRLEWNRITHAEITGPRLSIWADGNPWPCLVVSTAAFNFQAGYQLFQSLRQGDDQDLKALGALPDVEDVSQPSFARSPEDFVFSVVWTPEDHAALRRYFLSETSEGRQHLRNELGGWIFVILLLGMGYSFSLHSAGRLDAMIFLKIIAGVVAACLVSRAIRKRFGIEWDVRRTLKEAKFAQKAGRTSTIENLETVYEIAVGPLGYRASSEQKEDRRHWKETSALDQSDGYIFIQAANDHPLIKKQLLMIPPHVWKSPEKARSAFETMERWRSPFVDQPGI